ncbi:hypothetical protein N8371_09730 [Vicingaceae bacterium]|nr:hypothetical protein [Vicingaceae bacterium]
MEDFFDLEFIQNKSIQSITIYKSDKKDDDIFALKGSSLSTFFQSKVNCMKVESLYH